MTDDSLRSALSGWPAGAPLPRRLLALMKVMTGPSYVKLGDFDALDLDNDYLAAMWAQDPDRAPLFQAYFRSTPAKVGSLPRGETAGTSDFGCAAHPRIGRSCTSTPWT